MVSPNVPAGRKRRNIVRELLDLLTDNQLLNNAQIATVLGIEEQTIVYLRSTDAFKATLAARIEQRHGEALRSVRNNTLLAVNDALEATRRIVNDTATLPSMKLEAAKIAMDHYHRSEDRAAPKGPLLPGGGNQNVTINLSVQELQAARQASLTHGASLELEVSDHAHAANPIGNSRLLAGVKEGGG